MGLLQVSGDTGKTRCFYLPLQQNLPLKTTYQGWSTVSDAQYKEDAVGGRSSQTSLVLQASLIEKRSHKDNKYIVNFTVL